MVSCSFCIVRCPATGCLHWYWYGGGCSCCGCPSDVRTRSCMSIGLVQLCPTFKDSTVHPFVTVVLSYFRLAISGFPGWFLAGRTRYVCCVCCCCWCNISLLLQNAACFGCSCLESGELHHDNIELRLERDDGAVRVSSFLLTHCLESCVV